MKLYFLKTFTCLACLFISLLACSQPDTILAMAQQRLASGRSVSELLCDPVFDSIKTQAAFRELIRAHAYLPSVSLVSSKEPGTSIIVRGNLLNSDGKPLPGLLVYVYQTDTRGWYGGDRVHFEMMQGDRTHARLFGYLKTDARGGFEIRTVQPHGYPQSSLPGHILFEVFTGEGKALLISELLFDDDERLQGEVRERSVKDGFFIVRPSNESGHKVYVYTISTKIK